MGNYRPGYTLIDATGEPIGGDGNLGDLQLRAEPGDTIVNDKGETVWSAPDEEEDDE